MPLSLAFSSSFYGFLACSGVFFLFLGLLWIVASMIRPGGRWFHQGSRKNKRRVEKGAGFPLAELARRLEIPIEQLTAFTPRYAQRYIPKSHGKTRRLLVPDDATKKLQRRILKRLLAKLRAHPAACGFERGKSIVDNALPHTGKAVVIKMDVVDFFPSTRAERIDRYFRWIGWDAQCAAILSRLTTHDGGLPQGAPTSPRLSNLVNFYLDVQLANFAKKRKGTYTT